MPASSRFCTTVYLHSSRAARTSRQAELPRPRRRPDRPSWPYQLERLFWIQPAAHYQTGIGYFWDTNVGWAGSEDQQLIPALIAAIESGAFGPVDAARMYATGISSGGYIASRIANEFSSIPGQLDPDRPFRAVAIESASFESCVGAACVIPTPLPATHPPTLFLHGLLDPIVPIGTAQLYDGDLRAQAIPERFVTDAFASHQWIAAAPGEVLAWFQHR